MTENNNKQDGILSALWTKRLRSEQQISQSLQRRLSLVNYFGCLLFKLAITGLSVCKVLSILFPFDCALQVKPEKKRFCFLSPILHPHQGHEYKHWKENTVKIRITFLINNQASSLKNCQKGSKRVFTWNGLLLDLREMCVCFLCKHFRRELSSFS